MFSSINEKFGCCSEIFGCSNKKKYFLSLILLPCFPREDVFISTLYTYNIYLNPRSDGPFHVEDFIFIADETPSNRSLTPPRASDSMFQFIFMFWYPRKFCRNMCLIFVGFLRYSSRCAWVWVFMIRSNVAYGLCFVELIEMFPQWNLS